MSGPSELGESGGGFFDRRGPSAVASRRPGGGLSEQLGIHPATAYRYISVVKAIEICAQVERAPEGEVIELGGGDSYEVTKEVREKARQLRVEIVTGEVPMNRALPAVAGMFGVSGGGTGGKAATNHAANTWAALVKARNSISGRHWRQGKLPNGHSWDDAINQWAAILQQLPDELRAATAAWVKQGMPRTER